MENNFCLVIGNQIMPLNIHAVAADAAGNLVEVVWDGPARFDFPLMGWRITACLTEGDAARLELEADLGPMPFTAEARDMRAGLQAIVDAANAHVGSAANARVGSVLRVTRDRRIRLEVGGSADRPLTAVSLIATVTRLLAPVTPYLELLAVFLCPGGGSGPVWRHRGQRG
jgi:hypothetical protein